MRTSSNKSIFPLLMMALTILVAPQALIAAPSLSSVLKAASREGSFEMPQAEELKRAEHLFAGLLAGRSPESLAKDADQLDLSLIHASQPEALLVVEKSTARRGRGLFAFRTGQPHSLQVPHSFSDEMTREIGLLLFAEGSFAAAAWNTVPRHYQHNGMRIDADMAHLDNTYFTAFTRATARAHPQGTILQIHGFDQGKRKSAAAAAADLILSAGHKNPPTSLRRGWRCLSQQLGPGVLLYPEGSRELGGTSNAQVALLLGFGFQNFIHAELSRPLRQSMLDKSAIRKQLLDCLLESAQ